MKGTRAIAVPASVPKPRRVAATQYGLSPSFGSQPQPPPNIPPPPQCRSPATQDIVCQQAFLRTKNYMNQCPSSHALDVHVLEKLEVQVVTRLLPPV